MNKTVVTEQKKSQKNKTRKKNEMNDALNIVFAMFLNGHIDPSSLVIIIVLSIWK